MDEYILRDGIEWCRWRRAIVRWSQDETRCYVVVGSRNGQQTARGEGNNFFEAYLECRLVLEAFGAFFGETPRDDCTGSPGRDGA